MRRQHDYTIHYIYVIEIENVVDVIKYYVLVVAYLVWPYNLHVLLSTHHLIHLIISIINSSQVELDQQGFDFQLFLCSYNHPST